MLKYRILIIDDDPALCELIEDMLELSDVEFLTAYDAENGLVEAKYKSPDIILLDLVLPNMHGFEVYKQLKEDDRTKDIPVIVLTGHTDKKTLELSQELGITGIFYKPFNFGRLRKKIKNILGNKERDKNFCINCGRELKPKWEFCPYDGLKRNTH